ncbi:hypothetical protein GCM10008932_00200 [Alkalibacterium iburiense]|uniref:DUF1659 domain-containing protein n=1 Tax=Alkalibacterium iburiense TaxID=290589 RepID=A0ABN0WZX0_9LACT
MQKDWMKNKVDIYLEDALNEKTVRRSYPGLIQNLSEEQVTAFTEAIESVNELPVSHAVVVEEYRYSF